jgi:hypothetical protein
VRYMDLAMDPVPAEESAVVDFAVCLLTLLGYVPRTRITRTDPEPQLVAEAIAAFQTNNTRQTRVLCQAANDAKAMPGPKLVGSSPTFYKIPVTKELARAVAHGQFPATPTVVYARLPAVPRPARRLSEGMKPLDRRHILACYEAFRQCRCWIRTTSNDSDH